KMIAERSAEQKQGRQGQQVGIDHPLHLLRAGAVAGADGGQGDAEYRSFHEGQARREDAGDQRPMRIRVSGSSPPAAVAWAQSTCCAIAASTMLRHMPTSPTAAIASSGSRIVCSTASA